MLILDGMVKRLLKKTRNHLLRGLLADTAENRARLAAVQAQLAGTQSQLTDTLARLEAAVRDLDAARAEIQGVREEFGPRGVLGARANKVLAETGVLVNLSPEDRCGDGTLMGAMGYLSWETSVAAYRPAFQTAIDLLRSGGVVGPVVEFGTCTGFTSRIICELLAARQFDVEFYMYDSFLGLPEMTGTPDETSYDVSVNRWWYKGAMAVPEGYEEHVRAVTGAIRSASKVRVVKGFFEETLDAHLPTVPCSLIHVDCDIYSSAKYVLTKLGQRDLFQDGCVVMFDDWNCNRANPNMGERRAWAEFLRENPRWTCTPWFAYGWNAQAFILHDSRVGL
ncbi:MAG: hypothetical protein JWO38_535 [Gemmataceae bacterium]|nr:hypothetical protein [Gemmataceae bacterium]